MKLLLPILFLLFSLVACVPRKSEISVNINKKSDLSLQQTNVSSVQIINNQLVINGAGLSAVSNVKVNGNGLNEDFAIESQTSGQIIANSIRALSFDVSKVFNLILSDANAASATFAIDFSLCNSTLHNAGFDCTTAVNNNDVLTYNQTDNLWVPRSLNGLSYQGSWDSTTAQPNATLNGQYWIVSVASGQYHVGDWIIWKSSNSTFNHITYSSVVVSGVSSVYGRSGAVVATEGDYSLNQLADVNVVTPSNGQVLKFNGATWVAADESVGNPGSVTTTELADGSVTNAKIDSVASTKITGTITSAQIADGTIVNADISATAAIPYSKLNIADGDIPASKINGLPSGTASVSNGGTGVTTLGLNQLLFGNGTSPVGTLATTTVPSVLLSTITTGAPAWTTSTAGNFLKGSVTGVLFGAITTGDLPSGTLTGSGTANYIPYYSAATTMSDSPIAVSGTNVSIGSTTPGANTMLNVEGQLRSKSFSLTTGAVNWAGGNSGTTTFDCGSSVTFANLRDGGSYTLAVTGTGTAQCVFNTATTGDDAGTVSYRFIPTNAVRTANSHTIYSFQRIGSVVYVSWITGF